MAYTLIALCVAAVAGQLWYSKGLKSKKELWVYIFLILVAMFYSYAYIKNWQLPTIETVLTYIFDSASHIIFGEEYKK